MAACRPLDTEELKLMIAATGRGFHGLRDRTLILFGVVFRKFCKKERSW